jgi:PQQ-like domain
VLRVADGTAKRIIDAQRGVLALRDKTLYVASYTTGDLIAVSATGGVPKTVAKNLSRPTGIVADDHAVYVHTEGDHRVIRVDLASGARETLGDNLENADVLVLDRGSVYTMSWPNKLVRLTAGSAPVTLADDLEEPRAIAVDDHYVYVTTAKPPRIVRIAK